MLLIGPNLLSGIGQHLLKYSSLFPNSRYIQIGQIIPEDEVALIFALPIQSWLDEIPKIKRKVKKVICMTTCETEPVHEDYGKLFKLFDTIAVNSTFSQKVFKKQFPNNKFIIVRAYIPPFLKKQTFENSFNIPFGKYVFYHIGNVMDQRKNFKRILEAFMRLNLPNSLLVVKATCMQTVEIPLPNVLVINGLLPDLDNLHAYCDCYVSFSSSEGIGLGAVEAAMLDKPVIMPEYGGAPDYIKTPYLIKCGLQEIQNDDFLFKKGMIWGAPDFNQLMEFMKDAYDKKLRYMDHSHTKFVTSSDEILKSFKSI